MPYKPSMYNVYTTDSEGNVLIANLLHTTFLRVDRDLSDRVMEKLNSKHIDDDFVQEFKKLYERGYVGMVESLCWLKIEF